MARRIARITSEDDIAAGIRSLRRRCAVMRRVHDATGAPPLRVQQPGFPGLVRIIVGQQLSVASAAAIWGRCASRLDPVAPADILAADDVTLREVGLSTGKVRTLRAVARAITAGELDLTEGAYDSDDALREAMIAVPGIGPWTADIYLMFALGRPDAFAVGDLALQVGAQYAFDLAERPKPDMLEQLAEPWRPWRGVAARLLWAYYAHTRAQRPASVIPV